MKSFEENQTPSMQQINDLSLKLGLEPHCVKMWFRNQRQMIKRKLLRRDKHKELQTGKVNNRQPIDPESTNNSATTVTGMTQAENCEYIDCLCITKTVDDVCWYEILSLNENES